MRSDYDLNSLLAEQRTAECGFSPTLCSDGTFAQGKGYSCCYVPGSGQSGMTSNATCLNLPGGQWRSTNGKNTLCSESFDNIVLRPCCLGLTGTCSLMTAAQCFFVNGTTHADAQLCSQVCESECLLQCYVMLHLYCVSISLSPQLGLLM